MPEFTEILASRLAAGLQLEEALSQLHKAGSTPAQAIKAIRVTQGVSLGEAKQIFATSPAWALEVEANRALQDEAISLMSKAAEP